MSVELLIWLPDDPDNAWFWQSGSDGGEVQYPGEKSALADRDVDKTYVILSGQSVHMFEHTLPHMRDRERLSAAGFSIEDKIAAPLTDQHVVLGAGDDKLIAIISHHKMRAVTQALAKAGLRADCIFADFDVCVDNGEPIYLEDRIIYSGRLGYTTDRDWGGRDENAHLPSVLTTLEMSSSLNLLQGDYAVRRSQFGDVSGLRRVAALAVCAGVAWLVFIGMQGWAMNAQAEDLRLKTATLYTQATGKPAPANPALAVSRAAQSGTSSDADFLALSDILFRAVQSSPDISIDSLQFDGRADQLTLRLIYPRFESASELEQVVKQMGGTLRPGGVREQNGQLIGDAVLTRGGS